MCKRNLVTAVVLGLGLFGVAGAQPANAGVIISATSATIDAGGPGFGSINDTFNQNGLSAGYTPGVTDFDSYIASGPTHTLSFSGFEWFSNSGTTSATVTYNLGAVFNVDAVALWNEESSGIGSLDLLFSLDGLSFFSLALGLTPTDNPFADYGADVFAFAGTALQFVRFVMSDCPQLDPGSFPACAIGEVAFRVSSSEIPLPGAAWLLLTGIGALGAGRIRRARKAA